MSVSESSLSENTAPAVPVDSVIALNSESGHFFAVRLEEFDGPLDLLLHLVKQNELPIERLSLAQVAQQYLQCIEAARFFDLELAGEYLVIASTLVSIKAAVLLNEPVEVPEEDLSGVLDPHTELLLKLREMAVFKESAQGLSGRELLGVDVFQGGGTLEGVDAPPVRLKPHDPILLGKALRKMLERAGNAQAVLSFTVDSVTIVERMMKVVDLLKSASKRLTLDDIVENKESRVSIIGSFLALLELAKRQLICVTQAEASEAIYIDLREAQESLEPAGDFDSEFDHPESEETELKTA